MNKKAMKRNRTLSICLLATMLLSLMSPFAVAAAMAEDGEYICGKIEHVHDDSCIQDLGWHYLCMDEDADDQNHVHDESCYDSDGFLICLPAVRAAGAELYHEHNEFCYDERGELVCLLQERLPHVHSDICYATTIVQDPDADVTGDGAQETGGENTDNPDGILTPDNGEGEQDAADATKTDEAVAGATDGTQAADASTDAEENEQEPAGEQGAQSDSTTEFSESETAMALVEVDPYLICGLEETHGGVRHVHTAECLAPEHGLVLTCGMEEHVHTDACKPVVQQPELVIKPEDMMFSTNGVAAVTTTTENGVGFAASIHNDVVAEKGSTQEFYFTIEPKEDYSSVIMPDDNTATIEGTGDATFEKICFTAPGTYSFRIYEEEGMEHYRYDAREWEVTVTVTGTAGAPAGALGGQYDTSVYTVPADANKDGWLTEDEVAAVIAQIQEEYPVGTPWGEDKFYRGSGWPNGGYACAAFAQMASDRIFGDLPTRVLRDVYSIRIGDVTKSTTPHWAMVRKLWWYDEDPAQGAAYDIAGNVGGEIGLGVDAFGDLDASLKRGGLTIWTRYPAGTNTPSTLDLGSVTYTRGETTSTDGASFITTCLDTPHLELRDKGKGPENHG